MQVSGSFRAGRGTSCQALSELEVVFFRALRGSATGQVAGRAFLVLVSRPTLRSLTFGGSLLLSGRSLDLRFLQLLCRVFSVTFYLFELSLTPRLPP